MNEKNLEQRTERSEFRDRERDREAFLRDKEMLLKKYKGEFVTYVNGRFLFGARNYQEVIKKLRTIYNYIDVREIYVEQVDEKAFEEKGEAEAEIPVIEEVERQIEE